MNADNVWEIKENCYIIRRTALKKTGYALSGPSKVLLHIYMAVTEFLFYFSFC